jgi:hypothetical protein
MIMSKEVRDLKEKLIAQVNEIIMIQQKVDPVQKIETF